MHGGSGGREWVPAGVGRNGGATGALGPRAIPSGEVLAPQRSSAGPPSLAKLCAEALWSMAVRGGARSKLVAGGGIGGF